MRPTLAAFSDQFHLTADEQPLLAQLCADRPFDRRLWRHVAGELLLYGAAEAPAVQTAGKSLTALVSPDQREAIRQAHAGSRDLDFDGVPYRTGHAGWNDGAAVGRLAGELAQIDPTAWDLAKLSDDDPAEELAFARECFNHLRSVYEQAQFHGQVVVCEDI